MSQGQDHHTLIQAGRAALLNKKPIERSSAIEALHEVLVPMDFLHTTKLAAIPNEAPVSIAFGGKQLISGFGIYT